MMMRLLGESVFERLDEGVPRVFLEVEAVEI